MTEKSSSNAHVVLIGHPLWGHIRPSVGLACKLVRKCPGIVITIPVGGDLKFLTDNEIDRYLLSEEDKRLKENIHVISLGGQGKSIFDLFPVILGNFEPFYTSLHTLTPVKCATGRSHTFTRAPDVAIVDYFLLDCLHVIRKMTEGRVKVFSWNPTAIVPLMRLLGPVVLGGVGDIEARAKTISEETGKPIEEVEMEAGKIVKGFGISEMFDYEYYPQEDDPRALAEQLFFTKKAFKMLEECDGMVSATCTAYEFEGCKAAQAWFAETNRPMYNVGPLLPDDIFSDVPSARGKQLIEVDVAPNGQEIMAFLDRIYATFGPQSLIFASFGTLFWPSGNLIWKAFEVTLELNVPFLLAYDEQRVGPMPEYLAQKFKEADRAMVSNWVPQHSVLSHDCTGWFLTHCGYNSLIEAILQNVPMIGWPISADQPANAAHMSLDLKIAYEIVEGRSGLGLKPMRRGITPKGTPEALSEEIKMILEKAFGEDGKQKRENVRLLKEKIKASWKEGGDSFVDLDRFVKGHLDI